MGVVGTISFLSSAIIIRQDSYGVRSAFVAAEGADGAEKLEGIQSYGSKYSCYSNASY